MILKLSEDDVIHRRKRDGERKTYRPGSWQDRYQRLPQDDTDTDSDYE